jgi:Fibronectin type III domain
MTEISQAKHDELMARLQAAVEDTFTVAPEPGPTTVPIVSAKVTVGTGTATITWKVENDGGSPVLDFSVGRDGTDSAGTGPWEAVEAPTVTSRTFTKLVAGRTYLLDVTARNAVGRSATLTLPATLPGTPNPEPVPTPGPATVRPSGLAWTSGVWTNQDRAKALAFASNRGRPNDVVQVFPSRDKGWAGMLDTSWVNAVTPGADAVVKLPLWPENGSLTGQGADWHQLALNIARAYPTAWVALGWEMNIGQYWKITPANRDAWIAAWRLAASSMLQAAPRLRIGWNPNAGPDQTGVDCRAAFQAVKEYCTWYGVDSYDAWPPLISAAGLNTHLTATGYLGESYAYARANGKLFCLPEWGVSVGSQWAGHSGGDNPTYIREYLTWIKANASGIGFETYFSEPAAYLRSDFASCPKAGAEYNRIIKAG